VKYLIIVLKDALTYAELCIVLARLFTLLKLTSIVRMTIKVWV